MVHQVQENEATPDDRVETPVEGGQVDAVEVAGPVPLDEVGGNPWDYFAPLPVGAHAGEGRLEALPNRLLGLSVAPGGRFQFVVSVLGVRMNGNPLWAERRQRASQPSSRGEGPLEARAQVVRPLDSLGTFDRQAKAEEEREDAIEPLPGRGVAPFGEFLKNPVSTHGDGGSFKDLSDDLSGAEVHINGPRDLKRHWGYVLPMTI